MLDAGMFAAVSLFPVALLVRPRVWVSAAFKRRRTSRGWTILTSLLLVDVFGIRIIVCVIHGRLICSGESFAPQSMQIHGLFAPINRGVPCLQTGQSGRLLRSIGA